MRLPILLCAITLLGTLANAQYVIDLSKEEPLTVPNGLHIDSVIVSFNDSASIGEVLRGMGNRPVSAFLQPRVSLAVQRMLVNVAAAPEDLHCTMRINALRISEVSGGTKETCSCALNFELLSETDSGWVKLYEYGAVSSLGGGLDATGKQPRNIREAFVQGLADFIQARGNGGLVPRLLPDQHLGDPFKQDEPYAVLTTGAPRRGLYHTFFDMRDQQPDTSVPFDVKDVQSSSTRMKMAKLKIQGDGVRKDLWGFSDGRDIYVNIGRKYLKLVRSPEGFHAYLAFNELPPPGEYAGAALAAGLVGGLLGGVFIVVPISERVNLPVELDMLTGELRPIQIPDADLPSPMSEHLFIYSRHCPTDTTVDLFVYGGEEASLRQDSYHRLKLVPRANTVPVEAKVGDGAPVGIDISTDRTDVTQVYLIKVDKSGTPSIDHLNTQMAQALIEKLDPAKEVK